MKKIKLKITGMHCTSYAMSMMVEDYVKGIKSAKTSYAKQECEVEFDESKATVNAIVGQIKKTGYSAYQ